MSNKPNTGPTMRSTDATAPLPIDLCIFDLQPDGEQLSKLSGFLSPDEEKRAARLIASAAGNRFRIARGTLRLVLSSYVGTAPEQISFTYGPHGKPSTQPSNEPVYFNLSHTANVGAIAVSRHFEVGVDVEAWRKVHQGIAKRFFSQTEISALNAYSSEDRAAAFFRCWTRKEAVIKALGDGFSRPLTSFDVSIDDVAQPKMLRIENDNPDNWRLFNFAPNPKVSGAVACRSQGAPVDFRFVPVP